MKNPFKSLSYSFLALVPILIYARAFNGLGLWDDQFFIFDRYLNETHTYSFYWKYSLWPFFESTTLFLYKIFGHQTVYWHILNFVIHLLNGVLIGKIVGKFKPSLKLIFMFLFWVHPLCTLSVAWIIQLKTLLCFFFSLSALYLLLFKPRTKKIIISSAILFAFSVTTKSASVILPFVALFITLCRPKWRNHSKLTFPFIIISLLCLYRMSLHDDLQVTIKNSEATLSSLINDNKEPETISEPPSEDLPDNTTEPIAEVVSEVVPEVVPEVAATDPAKKESDESLLKAEITQNNQDTVSKIDLLDEPIQIGHAHLTHEVKMEAPTKLKIIAYTASYYLAAPWLPYDLSPIHSNYRGGFYFKNYFGFGLIAISLILIFFKKYLPIILLLSQLIILSPFLGIIVAPYMTFSIVSEQHLYMAIPFSLLSQLLLAEYVFKKHIKMSIIFLIVIFSIITSLYAPKFKNEETFYKHVLDVYPYDRLSALNLANFYFKAGRTTQALFILKKALDQAEERPYLKEDIMHEYLEKSYEKIKILN